MVTVIEWKLNERHLGLARMSDIDLRETVDDLICQVYRDDVDRHDLADKFFVVIDETFGRFAPSVEIEFNRRHNEDGAPGMRHSIDGMTLAYAARLTRVAEAQDDDDA